MSGCLPFSRRSAVSERCGLCAPGHAYSSSLATNFARHDGRLVGVGHGTELVFYCVSVANGTELAQLDLRGRPPLMSMDAIDMLLPRQPNDSILAVIGMMLSYLCFAMLM